MEHRIQSGKASYLAQNFPSHENVSTLVADDVFDDDDDQDDDNDGGGFHMI